MRAISKPATIASWVLQLAVAAILGQTLFYKFTGAPETKALFDVLGAEPLGRYGTAVMELAAVVLILVPPTVIFGAALAIVVVSGAMVSHVFKLGISIDPAALGRPELGPLKGSMLFMMAVAVFVMSAVVLVLRRSQVKAMVRRGTSPAD